MFQTVKIVQIVSQTGNMDPVTELDLRRKPNANNNSLWSMDPIVRSNS